MNIYPVFVHLHSGLRWVVLILIVAAIINAGSKLYFKSSSNWRGRAFNRLALLFLHVQVVLGLALYFISPKVIFNTASLRDSVLRFFLMEHIGIMLIAVVLLTIGYVRSDRATDEYHKHKHLLIYYSIAFLLILLAIPWPFRGLVVGWF